MSKEETSIDRMEVELAELDKKVSSLGLFVATDKFKELSPMEQQLLYIQISTMSTYGATLSTRIDLSIGREAGKEIKSKD